VNTQLALGLALLAAVVIMATCLAIGVLGYSPQRAEDIRAAEAETPLVVEEVRRIHVSKPDRFRRGRIDRHPVHVVVHGVVFGYALCVLAGAPVTSNVASMSPTQRFIMAACFLIGSALVLVGAAMGAKVWRWRFWASVHEHIARARLGDDIRLPYAFGGLGMLSMGPGGGIYASTSFGSTPASIGGWFTLGIAVYAPIMLGVFYFRVRQFGRTLRAVVDEAVANVIRRGGHDLE
jgi:hypothetical protein